MTAWMKRSDWTPTPATSSNGTWGDVLGMVAHYPAAGADIGEATQAEVAAMLRGWRSYHMNVRGWGDIGYNMAIDQAGRIWHLRGLDNVGAHCASAGWPTANTRYVGVLFVIGDNESLSEAAIDAWHALRAVVLAKFTKGSAVTMHGLVPGAQTRCAGPYVKGALPLLSTDTPSPVPPPVVPPAPTATKRAPVIPDALHYGSQSALVGLAQEALKKAGLYVGKIDDSFGPQTQAATKAFQRGQKITVDGSIWKETWAHLLLTDGPILHGDTGFEVAILQVYLGWPVGSAGNDKNFGPATEARTRQMQTYLGITADGSVWTETRTALKR